MTSSECAALGQPHCRKSTGLRLRATAPHLETRSSTFSSASLLRLGTLRARSVRHSATCVRHSATCGLVGQHGAERRARPRGGLDPNAGKTNIRVLKQG